jgi:hypothetical protein
VLVPFATAQLSHFGKIDLQPATEDKASKICFSVMSMCGPRSQSGGEVACLRSKLRQHFRRSKIGPGSCLLEQSTKDFSLALIENVATKGLASPQKDRCRHLI